LIPRAVAWYTGAAVQELDDEDDDEDDDDEDDDEDDEDEDEEEVRRCRLHPGRVLWPCWSRKTCHSSCIAFHLQD
jgi:hypothetical protein